MGCRGCKGCDPPQWIRHELPPWERARGYITEYGLDLGERGWVLVSKRRVVSDDTGERTAYQARWSVVWAMCGLHGPGCHIVSILFAARTLKAAKQLAELWTGTLRQDAAGGS